MFYYFIFKEQDIVRVLFLSSLESFAVFFCTVFCFNLTFFVRCQHAITEPQSQQRSFLIVVCRWQDISCSFMVRNLLKVIYVQDLYCFKQVVCCCHRRRSKQTIHHEFGILEQIIFIYISITIFVTFLQFYLSSPSQINHSFPH